MKDKLEVLINKGIQFLKEKTGIRRSGLVSRALALDPPSGKRVRLFGHFAQA